jgi:hypothetical protein
MVRLASYKHVVWWDIGAWIIRKVTRKPYSHSELIVGNNSYSSSIQDEGVRKEDIDILLRNPEHWDVRELKWAKDQDVIDYYLETQDEPYGWFDLLSQYGLHLNFESRGDFCSQWCAKALKLPNPGRYSPGSLDDMCEQLNNQLK